MKNTTLTKMQQFNQITQIIKGKPAASLASLPDIWQKLSRSGAGTGLSDHMRMMYIEAARLFNYHGTPLAMEALSVIGKDFQKSSYPDLSAWMEKADSETARSTIAALQDVFAEFGYDMPSSFYNAILQTSVEGQGIVGMRLFKKKNALMRDRLWDAVLHGSLLVTPIGLYIQSIFSQHGTRFEHLMDCSCSTAPTCDKPFVITLDADFKAAYLQNLVAAALEQYGVNAMTSRMRRGF